MDLWDPSLPGAGAQRAVCIVQLYMRMVHHSPIAVLIVDALCLTFKTAGATLEELGAYLGLATDRVELGLAGIPKEIYCTSYEVCQEEERGAAIAHVATEETSGNVDRDQRGEGRARTDGSSPRYYINYATFLPFAYAHGAHILLALSQQPLPQLTSVSGKEPEVVAINVSPTLRRADCRGGLCCSSCHYWMALRDLTPTVSKCPLCQVDILDNVLSSIKAHYDAKIAQGHQLLIFGPVSQQRASKVSITQSEATRNGTITGPGDVHNCLLARDPFLVQQGLFFKRLYTHPFVCLREGECVVDVDEVMTKPEYEHRSKHKATVLDQFRLVHRNPGAIRVQLINQERQDAEKCLLSAMKVAKRTQLPPWLRLASSSVDSCALASPCSSASEKVAVPGAEKRGRDVLGTAKYVAREFFDDDFDEVPLQVPRFT
ncbi:hypothetical protein TRVL_01722 [Trypanosoma vivax]|nr:hypothetical protein TRVL_01722 [Trypanosoma vivax]